MQDLIQFFENPDFSLGLLAFASLLLLASPKIPTGIVGSTGLIMFIVGCLAGMDISAFSQRAFAFRVVGMGLAMWPLIWYFMLRRWWLRWSAHWPFAHKAAWLFGIDRRKSTPDRRKDVG